MNRGFLYSYKSPTFLKLLHLLSKPILIPDPPLPTLFHSHPFQSTFQQFNLSHPHLIISIHKQYL
ncbi:hypothetical protein, partial [Bacillus thuringiensis]|uniref:hypothetical protein n=1 Tax=Bacillus thuringiensis TaxID=1428 RepID=UPI0021B6C2FD